MEPVIFYFSDMETNKGLDEFLRFDDLVSLAVMDVSLHAEEQFEATALERRDQVKTEQERAACEDTLASIAARVQAIIDEAVSNFESTAKPFKLTEGQNPALTPALKERQRMAKNDVREAVTTYKKYIATTIRTALRSSVPPAQNAQAAE